MKIGAYADGTYQCKCAVCKTTFSGDKRAVQCLQCAALALQAQLADTEEELADYKIGCESLKESVCEIRDERDALQEENLSFGDVLALIHRDGGHYISQHGHEKASKDAIKIVLDLRLQLDKIEVLPRIILRNIKAGAVTLSWIEHHIEQTLKTKGAQRANRSDTVPKT